MNFTTNMHVTWFVKCFQKDNIRELLDNKEYCAFAYLTTSPISIEYDVNSDIYKQHLDTLRNGLKEALKMELIEKHNDVSI